MKQEFINYELLENFAPNVFLSKPPYPWHDFHRFLTPEGFAALYENFPPLDVFEVHSDMERVYGQRPHNRYYLAYEESVYARAQAGNGNKGTVKQANLPEAWRMLMDEFETSERYRNFIKRLFQVSEFQVRYAWHVGVTNSEVSPHVDGDKKIGTHIFYFNTSEDWNPAWGGATLVLGSKLTSAMNPDFNDFTAAEAAQITDNHSFLFRNGPHSWHGVKPLTCPEGSYRRLFNVIFEVPEKSEKAVASPLSAIKRLFRGRRTQPETSY
ncbi:MAG: 2OG-Fe(II) oxygenase [Acidobacteriota bacterium]|nr:2OG-Fe(II) oxygenase [Acidobacteriota bacterium]